MKDERKAIFTSSGISALMSNGRKVGTVGKPFNTYVDSKIYEGMVGRSINNEAKSSSLDWGNMCEPIAHDLLPLEYQLVSKDRYFHLDLPWSGMPDGLVKIKGEERIVTDIKCPFTLLSFMQMYVKLKKSTDIAETLKDIKPEYYWQLISNSILTNSPICELILFMPKFDRLEEIEIESEKAGYYFHMRSDMAMPWTSNESDISEISKFRFVAPEEDKLALIDRVTMAANFLKS